MGKTLVAYFSASGVTKKLAQTLADAIGADLFAIEPKVPYTKADLNWMDKQSRSTIEMQNPASRPEIAGVGSGMGGTNKALAPSCKGARLVEGKVFRSSTSTDTLREWVKTLK